MTQLCLGVAECRRSQRRRSRVRRDAKTTDTHPRGRLPAAAIAGSVHGVLLDDPRKLDRALLQREIWGRPAALASGPALARVSEIDNGDQRLRPFAKLSPSATGSSGTQRATAGSSHVQVPERLAERRRQTGFGASLSGVRPDLGQLSGIRPSSMSNTAELDSREAASLLLC